MVETPSDTQRRTLRIDFALFNDAFARDVNLHHHHSQSAYLDRQSGDVIWVYDKGDDGEMEDGFDSPPG